MYRSQRSRDRALGQLAERGLTWESGVRSQKLQELQEAKASEERRLMNTWIELTVNQQNSYGMGSRTMRTRAIRSFHSVTPELLQLLIMKGIGK